MKEVVINGWVARDKEGICFFEEHPTWCEPISMWKGNVILPLKDKAFSNVAIGESIIAELKIVLTQEL